MTNNDSGDSDSSNDSNDEEKFKHYMFLVNSLHNVYLISSQGDIKFHRTSEKGYSTVEVINRRMGLCILAEQNSNSVECWNLRQNKLVSTIDLSTNLPVKQVLCTPLKTHLIIVVLVNGTILFYMFKDSTFIHRGTIDAGKHLDVVIVEKDKLICTFDSTIPIDFAHIDLQPLSETQQILSDKDIIKTLVAFNPPISPKPIQKIILPDDNDQIDNEAMKLFFIALTKESLCVVHVCRKDHISYVRIPGQYDVVSTHVKRVHFIYTARGGTINMFKWKCIEGEDNELGTCDIHHIYQLFLSIDISSSAVLTIKPSSDSGKNILINFEIYLFPIICYRWFISLFDAKWNY
jgi:hypothetical protein